MLRRKQIVLVASDAELCSRSYRNRLKMAVRNTGRGQRDWPTSIQDALLYADMKGIELRYPCGARFAIPLVDDVWNGNERYVREFLASETCKFPEKDRLIDLYFRVMMPDIARHFSR